jgi:transposase
MGDVYSVVKVAAVQAASVFLDREGSTEKACRLIREVGRNGARVIGFPEGFIPAHPVWYHHHSATGTVSNRLAIELFKNSVEIPGPEVDALCLAARDANAYVVVGVCEKLPNTTGTMFNSQIYIAPDGTLIGKHQKIMPTVGERLVHMGGFGDTYRPDGRRGRHPLCRMQSRARDPDEAPARFCRPLQSPGYFPPPDQSSRSQALLRARRRDRSGARLRPRRGGEDRNDFEQAVAAVR